MQFMHTSGMSDPRNLARSAAAVLAAARGRLGLSQQAIADRLKCSQGRISRLESGGIARVPIGEANQIAEAYGLRLEELFT